jgi:hypothetical protein
VQLLNASGAVHRVRRRHGEVLTPPARRDRPTLAAYAARNGLGEPRCTSMQPPAPGS